MTEQMRAVTLDEPVDGWHIDGQPYDFPEGSTVVLPRGVARRIVRSGYGHFDGDVFEIDDDEYRDTIGVRDDSDIPDPTDLTVDDLRDVVDDLDEAELEDFLKLEREGDDRTSAIELIESQIE